MLLTLRARAFFSTPLCTSTVFVNIEMGVRGDMAKLIPKVARIVFGKITFPLLSPVHGITWGNTTQRGKGSREWRKPGATIFRYSVPQLLHLRSLIKLAGAPRSHWNRKGSIAMIKATEELDIFRIFQELEIYWKNIWILWHFSDFAFYGVGGVLYRAKGWGEAY